MEEPYTEVSIHVSLRWSLVNVFVPHPFATKMFSYTDRSLLHYKVPAIITGKTELIIKGK